MAMPTSGSIAIISAPQTCGSICAAVGCASGSLTTLSVAASKASPHCMREFYGYSPIVKTAINWTRYVNNSVGTSCACSYFCIATKPAVGQTYTICIRGDLSTANQASGSYALICVTCNGLSKMYCCINNLVSCSYADVSFSVDYNDCIRSCNRAYASNTSCSLCSRSTSCIFSVTGTYHCKGTTCTNGFTYTG